ncbi:MAG: hypothetical protein QM817_24375 [Archangium sp.]
MWLTLALAVALNTTPPLVPLDDPEQPPPPQPAQPVKPPADWISPPLPMPASARARRPEVIIPPARFALWFSPLSLFGLSLWVEPELHLAEGVSIFLNVGGGFLGQLGGDLGVRYAVSGKPFEGFYLDARASVFSLPAAGLVMMGPGLQLGHAWRTPRLALSIALGFTTWLGVARANPTALFVGNPVVDADVILLAGVSQPHAGQAGVQPALRFTFGPTF